MGKLSVIIPAYNEAESLRRLLPDLIEFCTQQAYRLIIINDGSTDDSRQVLEQFKDASCLKVVTHKVNRGYGGAIKSGIRLAKTKYVITIDADGQHDLDDVTALHREIVQSDADMIVGNRGSSGDTSVYRSLGKKLIRWFARLLLPVPVVDLNSGIKIYNAGLAKRYLFLCPDHMAFSDIITLVFVSQKRLVLERPVSIRPRLAGTSTISTLTAMETIQEILNIVILFNPMRVFFPAAALFFVGSVLWGIPIVLAGRGISIGVLLGISTGFFLLLLGLLAEQISQIRKSGIRN